MRPGRSRERAVLRVAQGFEALTQLPGDLVWRVRGLPDRRTQLVKLGLQSLAQLGLLFGQVPHLARIGGEFVQVADQQSRFVILDVGGDTIVIAIETFPGVPFGGLLEASMDRLGAMRIEPGEWVPPQPTPSPSADPGPPSPGPTAPSGSSA